MLLQVVGGGSVRVCTNQLPPRVQGKIRARYEVTLDFKVAEGVWSGVVTLEKFLRGEGK